MATKVSDSRWDLRKPWVSRESLSDALHALLSTERGAPTRDLADSVECTMNQARAALRKLQDDGRAYYIGETHWRLWYRTTGK